MGEIARPGRVTAAIGLFVLLAAPLALYSWRVLSDLLAGHVEPASLGITMLALSAFALLAMRLGRYLGSLGDADSKG